MDFIIDLVMFAWNRSEYTKMTLESLVEIDCGVDFSKVNFVVINHDSEDNTAEIIETFMKQHPEIINKFDTQPNRGVAGGFEHFRLNYNSNAKYIGKIDNDSIFTKSWLKNLIDALNYSPKLGVVGAQEFETQGKKGGKFDYYYKVSHVGGRFLAKKEVFEISQKLKGEGVRGWTEFQDKFITKKWDIGWCIPTAVIEHVGDKQSRHIKSIKNEKYLQYMKIIANMRSST